MLARQPDQGQSIQKGAPGAQVWEVVEYSSESEGRMAWDQRCRIADRSTASLDRLGEVRRRLSAWAVVLVESLWRWDGLLHVDQPTPLAAYLLKIEQGLKFSRVAHDWPPISGSLGTWKEPGTQGVEGGRKDLAASASGLEGSPSRLPAGDEPDAWQYGFLGTSFTVS